MNRTAKKSTFLGMNWSVANNKLRKMIIFDLLKKSNSNICYNCGDLIESIDDLSVEHIKPWENIDPALFWDMDNIAFSHLKCNLPHTYRQRKIVDDSLHCNSCGEIKHKDSFDKRSTSKNGYVSHCKSCRKEKDTRTNHHRK